MELESKNKKLNALIKWKDDKIKQRRHYKKALKWATRYNGEEMIINIHNTQPIGTFFDTQSVVRLFCVRSCICDVFSECQQRTYFFKNNLLGHISKPSITTCNPTCVEGHEANGNFLSIELKYERAVYI